MSNARFADHPAVAHQQAVIANLKRNTAKTLDEWVRLVKTSAPKTRKERVQWLKTEHRLGMTTANVIAGAVEGRKPEDDNPQKFLDGLYTGAKAVLRPINDELVRLGMAPGPDVTATPCKTFVPLRRRHVFAQIKPTTNTRIDLGLALGKTKATGRLIDTGGLAKGDRITHRISITSVSEIDAEVKRWMKTAYEMDKTEAKVHPLRTKT
jgi:hypothetical protein